MEKIQNTESQVNEAVLPSMEDVKVFAGKATEALKSLSFLEKKAIIANVVDRVTGTQKELLVYGHLPIININKNVQYFTENRHCGAS